MNKIYRIKTRNNDISKIIIEFNDKYKKEEKLSAFKFKFKSNPVTAKEIHPYFPDNKIYLNE